MPNMGMKSSRTSVAGALFTATQQRVLALLFGQPDRAFLQSEVIDRADSGSGAVRRALDRLTVSGLVTVKRVGAQKHYQANRSAPIFGEIRGIVIKTIGLADPLRASLRRLSQIHLAFVYGSVARGEDRAESDIDLLVVADDLTLESLFARLAPVEKRLGRKINPTLYTRLDFERRRKSGNAFLKKVLAGKKLMLIGTADDDSDTR
jgi:predicted nucleotidyltransferase